MDRLSSCRERERDRGKAIFLAYARGEGKFDEFIAGCSRVGTLYTIIHTR